MQKIIFSFIMFVFSIYAENSESESTKFIEESRPWNDDGGKLFESEATESTGFSDIDQRFEESEERAESIRKEIKGFLSSLKDENK